MPQRLPGTALRVRRGRRHDLEQIRAVLGAPASARLERVYRRILADLGTDVYVAEAAGGEIVGLVSVVYARSLARGGISALLDGARVRREPVGPLLAGLVAFAEQRARRRGCRRLGAWVDAGDTALRAALVARGYRGGEFFVTELGEPA
jgi:hypothetical protein